MQSFTYFLLKAALSVLLLFVMAFAGREIYVLWFVKHVTLAAFAYQKDGTENEAQGKAFSQRVYQELRNLQKLLDGGQDDSAQIVEASAKLGSAASTRVSSQMLPPMVPAIGNSLTIPEIQKLPLTGVELKVQGVDVASFVRSLMQWIDPPDEFAGSVVEGTVDNLLVFNTFIERRQAGQKQLTNFGSSANGHSSLEDAAFATACNIAYQLMQGKESAPEKKLYSVEFAIFARSLRYYSAYRVAIIEMRGKAATDKAALSLDEADRLVSGLVDRGVADRFPTVNMLAAIVAIAKSDYPRARDYLAAYKKEVPSDQKAAALESTLPPPPTLVTTSERVVPSDTHKEPAFPRQKYRPVQPGVSAASGEQTAGTLCCIVQDKTNKTKYFLSADHVFSGAPGVSVIQPSPLDGGSAAADQIGNVVRRIDIKNMKEIRAAATLASISSTIQIDPKCFGVGAFAGVADVSLGQEVILVGRTSGVRRGRVVAIDVTINSETGSTVDGLIACQAADGASNFSQAGDSGAPVLDASNHLIGMSFAGSPTTTFVMPIGPILEALNVELVTN